MKKLLSVLIVAVMVLSTLSFVAPTGATNAQHTLDANNVAIDVPYFSGTTNYYDITGKRTDDVKTITYVDSINVSDKTGSGVLNLDGTITEAEWGKPIAEIGRDYAATFKGTEPSAENTYYWHVSKGANGAYPQRFDMTKDFSYKIWMAWDEDYLYIAAEVNDPDGPMGNEANADIWCGDTLQFIVDPEGPNSIVNGHGYSAAGATFPWASAEWGGGSWKYSGKTCNIGVGYLTGNFGGVNMYDMARRYYPDRHPVYDFSGNIDYWATDWSGCDIFYKSYDLAGDPNYLGGYVPADNPLMGDKVAFAAVLPTKDPTPDNTRHYTTTYEVAVPWELMSGSYIEFDNDTLEETLHLVEPNPQAGDEYGFSVAVLNGAGGGSEENSWLTWGSGVCHAQIDTADFMTAGGSNSMVLVSDELGTGGCDHNTFTAPTCTDPYVCTDCGYRKGFKTGHKYTSELVTPLGATTDGVIEATCEYCGDVQTITVPAVAQVVNAECPATPVVAPPLNPDSEWFTDGWNTIYKYKESGNPYFYPDGSMRTTYHEMDGEMVFDLSDHIAGTYFQTRNNRVSYSYKYCFKLTPETYSTYFDPILGNENSKSDNYAQGLYHTFGGIQALADGSKRYGLKYSAGFFPDAEGSTSGTFKIMEAAGDGTVVVETEEEPVQRVFCETDTIDLGTGWHDVIFVYDENEGAAFYYLDGVCIMAAWDEGFKMNHNDQVSIIKKFEVPCIIKDLGLGSTTAFFEAPTDFTVTCDGEVIGTFEAGETVTLPVPANKTINRLDARFFTWEGNATVFRGRLISTNTTANKRVYTMTMPDHDVDLTSRFVIIGDLDDNGAVNAKDVLALKKGLSGAQPLNEIQSEAADIDLDGAYNAKDLQPLKKKVA